MEIETNIPALQGNRADRRRSMLEAAIEITGATPAEGVIPGLWNVPGYPELTTGQLLQIAADAP